MPKKRAQANGHDPAGHDSDEIPIPPAAPASGPTTDENLLKMQEKMFTVSKEDETPPVAKKKPDRASELIQGAKTALEGDEKKVPPAKDSKDDEEEEEESSELTLPAYSLAALEEDEEEEGEEAPPAEDSTEEDEGDPDEPPAEIGKETNIKTLRKMAADFRRERNTLREENQRINNELKERPAAEALRGKIATLEARIKELEPYQLVFGLHQHPEYQERVAKEKGVISEMETIAKDYDVDPTVIQKFVTIGNRKEMDVFLAENFDSPAAATDLKILKQRLDGMVRDRKELEKQPDDALRRLEEQRTEKEVLNAARRKQLLEKNRDDGWAAALHSAAELQDDEKLFELVEVPGNKLHNEKVVRPTLAEGRRLREMGLTHIERMIEKKAAIDQPFVRWFATLCQQTAATGMVHAARVGIYRKLQAIQKEAEKQNGYERPGVTFPGRSTPAGGKSKKRDGNQAAAEIFDSVMSETGRS